MTRSDVLVLGGGPAGLAAAGEAARRGLDVVLLHEGERVRPVPGARVQGGRIVWSVVHGDGPGFEVDALGPSGPERHAAPHLVVAGGTMQRIVPLPGWTLPGVDGLVPGPIDPQARRAVVAGCGTGLVACALRLAAAGVRVAAVVDLSSRAEWLALAPSMLARLARRRIPVLHRHAVLHAEGGGTLSRVLVAPVDAAGTPRGHGRWITADALRLGHGTDPAAEVARLLRAPHRFDPARDRWVPRTDRHGATGIPGLSIAAEPDRLDAVLARPRPGLLAAMPGATVVCPCEGITRDGIDAAFEAGAREVNQLKHFTRCGMGPCQGRLCAEAAAGLLALRAGGRARVGQWTMRPPLRPVPLAALLGTFDYADIPVPPPAPL